MIQPGLWDGAVGDLRRGCRDFVDALYCTRRDAASTLRDAASTNRYDGIVL